MIQHKLKSQDFLVVLYTGINQYWKVRAWNYSEYNYERIGTIKVEWQIESGRNDNGKDVMIETVNGSIYGVVGRIDGVNWRIDWVNGRIDGVNEA